MTLLRFQTDQDYTLGMIRDLPSLEIPPGGTYDQLNLLNDLPGILRLRGGSTALVSGSQTAFATSLGFAVSDDATPIEELYGANGKDGKVYSISKSTGAATLVGTPFAAGSMIGRPARHFGFLVFPGGTTRAAIVAGQTSATTFTSGHTANIVAGNPQITLTGGDATTNVKVGAYVLGVTASVTYAGRVVSIDSGTTFSVWPVPTTTLSPTAASLTCVPVAGTGSTNGGVCAASFQNRLLFGNTFDIAALASSASTSRSDRRINYGVLPTETGINAGQVQTGAAGFMFAPNWPNLNYITAPGSDPIVAMESLADNELLILTATHPVIFRGNLVTQLSTTSPTVTWDESDSNQPYGCLSDLSVQRTSRGIVWAGAGGVYCYDGSSFHTLTGDRQNRRIGAYWRSLSAGSSTLVIHGSFYSREHYVISGTSGGTTFALACNMDNLQWARMSGAGTDVFYGLARPSIPSQVFVSRWWDQTGAAPSMTNGQTLRADTMFDAYVLGTARTDADGTPVAFTVTTKPIGGDLATQKLWQSMVLRYALGQNTAVNTVTGQSKTDAADINTGSVRALGVISSTETSTITAATNASPIAITCSAAHGLQTDDYVNVDAVTGNTAANGRWRITVTGGTTFTLNASTGNAAYVSGGQAQRVTEASFNLASLNKGQAASFTITGAGIPRDFQLQGVKVGFLEVPLGVVA